MVNRIRREQLTIPTPSEMSNNHGNAMDPTLLRISNNNGNVMVGESNESQSIECPE